MSVYQKCPMKQMRNLCMRMPRRYYVSAEELTIQREKHFHLSRYADQVAEYAGKEPTRRTVQEQLLMGQKVMRNQDLLIESAAFLQEEMLVRLARSIRSFQNLPYIVGINPKIQDVYIKCWDWFTSLQDWTEKNGVVSNSNLEESFTNHLLQVFQDHGDVMHNLRKGVHEIRALPSSESVDFDYVDKFITQFIMRRISWRVLAETHLALKEPKGMLYNGVFNLECKPSLLGLDALSKIQYLCDSELGASPDFAVKGDTSTSLEYIDAHLSYVLYELFKNSMRATVNFNKDKGGVLPKVVMRICHGEDITISIHDRGGGIPPAIAEKIWVYGFTTVTEDAAPKSGVSAYFPGMTHQNDNEEDRDSKPLAGWGFGLPLSRCYIEYLGGNVQLNNMPGYGTDTILTLPKLSSDRCRERLDFA